MSVKTYGVTGSHRTEKEIKCLIGRDPEVHSGMRKSGFCVRVTIEEHYKLRKNGIKINLKADY